jgi:hypothetical protein
MVKEKFIFKMAHYFKDGLIKVKQKVLIIFSFIQMDHSIEEALKIQSKMVMDNYFFIQVSNIKELGKMEYPMVKIADKDIQIIVHILEILMMVLNKAKEYTYGLIK